MTHTASYHQTRRSEKFLSNNFKLSTRYSVQFMRICKWDFKPHPVIFNEDRSKWIPISHNRKGPRVSLKLHLKKSSMDMDDTVFLKLNYTNTPVKAMSKDDYSISVPTHLEEVLDQAFSDT